MKDQKVIQSIVDQIEKTFPRQPVPPFPKGEIGVEGEMVDIDRFFNGIEWPEVPQEAFNYSYDVEPITIFYYTYPELWAYYLPAYISCILSDKEYSDIIYFSVLTHLNWIGDKNAKGEQLVNRCISLLTDAQRQAVAAFVRLVLSEDECAEAEELENAYQVFWSKYIGSPRERRRHPRVNVELNSLFTASDLAPFSGKVVNISEGGALIQIEPRLKCQQSLLVELEIEGKLETLPATVVREQVGKGLDSDVHMFGIQFSYATPRLRDFLRQHLQQGGVGK